MEKKMKVVMGSLLVLLMMGVLSYISASSWYYCDSQECAYTGCFCAGQDYFEYGPCCFMCIGMWGPPDGYGDPPGWPVEIWCCGLYDGCYDPSQ